MLKDLPSQIGHLEKLKEFNLSGNNLGQDKNLSEDGLANLINALKSIRNKKCKINLQKNKFSDKDKRLRYKKHFIRQDLRISS